MKNPLVAELLFKIADLLEMQEKKFEHIAYRNAARTIEGMSKDIENEWKEGRLYEIPGVGRGIGEKIEEFLVKGRSDYYDELKKKMPMDVDALLNIEGLGSKKVMVLYKKLKIKNIADLKKAAEAKKIQKLEGFGEKSEQKILHAIEVSSKSTGRMLLGFALPIAEEIVEDLRSSGLAGNVSIAGSTRRMKETIGDLDVLVTSSKPAEVADYFCKMKSVQNVIEKGSTRSSVRLVNGLQVDLRVLPESEYGSALMYFTGSKEHNVALRKIAISNKMKLSEYGLFKANKKIAGKTEEEVYAALKMDYIPPEIRENTGEIELALKKNLPKLVERKDILCDLQMHTKWSDGANSVEEMDAKAAQIGHKYIAVTDHAGPLKIANSMDEKRLKKYCEEIDKISKKSPIHILKGAEVDILKDGSLGIQDSALKLLDIVLVSIHSNFLVPKEEITKRLLKAMDNKYTCIIAHPTGRKLKIKESYALDFDKIYEKAKSRNIALEIDCHPERTDLNDAGVRAAVEAGVKLSIGTDSHAAGQLDFIRCGIGTASRGWASQKDIINTMQLEKMMKFFGR